MEWIPARFARVLAQVQSRKPEAPTFMGRDRVALVAELDGVGRTAMFEPQAALLPLVRREEVRAHFDEPWNHLEDRDPVPGTSVAHAESLFVEAADNG